MSPTLRIDDEGGEVAHAAAAGISRLADAKCQASHLDRCAPLIDYPARLALYLGQPSSSELLEQELADGSTI
jgi:hypothetical protein